jgi:phage/plasmid-like protein (TIGR03299 family)
MSSEFLSGTFARTGAWHGDGNIVTDEAKLTADYFFVDANALFPVSELELWGGNPADPGAMVPIKQRAKAIWRPDTRHVLGTVSPGYQIIPNSTLLDFAKQVEKEAEIDAVVVLREGAKVAFTAQLRDLTGTVVPGDEVKRMIVGVLGHDGKTALSGMFTNIRVVCANTLGLAMRVDGTSGSGQFSIRHTNFEINQIDRILEQIDYARQSFPEVVDLYRAMRDIPVDDEGFRHYLNDVYALPPVFDADGNGRPGDIFKDAPRKADALMSAWYRGIGVEIPGVAKTLWGSLNAITEVEGSLPDAANAKRKFHSAMLGSGRRIIQRAEATARQMVGVQ